MCFDLTHAPVATAARAAATGLVSMSTRPDPEGSGVCPILPSLRRQSALSSAAESAATTCPIVCIEFPAHGIIPPTPPVLLPTRLGPITIELRVGRTAPTHANVCARSTVDHVDFTWQTRVKYLF